LIEAKDTNSKQDRTVSFASLPTAHDCPSHKASSFKHQGDPYTSSSFKRAEDSGLTIGKSRVLRRELDALGSGHELSRTVIDAYLATLQSLSKKETGSWTRRLIAKTDFTHSLLVRESMPCKTYVFDYE
jgi:hypothetical protein